MEELNFSDLKWSEDDDDKELILVDLEIDRIIDGQAQEIEVYYA